MKGGTSRRSAKSTGGGSRIGARPPARTATMARARSMHGLFVAAGPRIKSGLIVKPFENIHVYDFICAVMGLTPATE